MAERPGAPLLFENIESNNITWRGPTGAASYEVERADGAGGPWSVVGRGISDAVYGFKQLYADVSAAEGGSYYYRVAAFNEGGKSGYSNVVGPVAGVLYIAGRNEIVNPGFELGDSGWSVSAGSFETVEGAGHDGSRAAQITAGTEGGSISQIIEVSMNRNYELSFWVMGGGVGLKVFSRDMQNEIYSGADTGGGGEWKRVTFRFNTRKYENIALKIILSDQGVYFLDDFAITEAG